MVSLDVSTSGLVPAYEYNINGFLIYVSTSGLVPDPKDRLKEGPSDKLVWALVALFGVAVINRMRH